MSDLGKDLPCDELPCWELLLGIGDESIGEKLEQYTTGHPAIETNKAPGLARIHHVTLKKYGR